MAHVTVIRVIAASLLVAGCASAPAIGTIAGGECALPGVHTPQYKVLGKTHYDQNWADDTTEGLVRGCNQARPHARPASFDKRPVVKKKAALRHEIKARRPGNRSGRRPRRYTSAAEASKETSMVGTVVWIVVLHFTVYGFDAEVLPQGPITGYRYKSSCERTIPRVKDIVDKTASAWMPKPKAIICEQIKIASVKSKATKLPSPPKEPKKAKRWWQF